MFVAGNETVPAHPSLVRSPGPSFPGNFPWRTAPASGRPERSLPWRSFPGTPPRGRAPLGPFLQGPPSQPSRQGGPGPWGETPQGKEHSQNLLLGSAPGGPSQREVSPGAEASRGSFQVGEKLHQESSSGRRPPGEHSESMSPRGSVCRQGGCCRGYGPLGTSLRGRPPSGARTPVCRSPSALAGALVTVSAQRRCFCVGAGCKRHGERLMRGGTGPRRDGGSNTRRVSHTRV